MKFNAQRRKEVVEAVVIAVLTTAATKLLEYGLERWKAHQESKRAEGSGK